MPKCMISLFLKFDLKRHATRTKALILTSGKHVAYLRVKRYVQNRFNRLLTRNLITLVMWRWHGKTSIVTYMLSKVQEHTTALVYAIPYSKWYPYIVLKALWHEHNTSCTLANQTKPRMLLDIFHQIWQYRWTPTYESEQFNAINTFWLAINYVFQGALL